MSTLHRHPSLDEICTTLSRIRIGRAARALLADGPITGDCAIAIPVDWSWVLAPVGAVGRKDRPGTDSDERYLMPCRITYTCPAVFLVAGDETAHLEWSAEAMTLRASGTTTISATPNTPAESLTAPARSETTITAPETMTLAVQSASIINQRLAELVGLGRDAEWRFRLACYEHVRRGLNAANWRIAKSIGRPSVVDETLIDALADDLVLGEGDDAGAISRLMDRCINSGFARVDPLRYISTTIRRDTHDAIRGHLGDPRIGPALRRWVAENNPRTIAELINGWNTDNPDHRIGAKRAYTALSLGPDVMAAWYSTARAGDGSTIEFADATDAFDDLLDAIDNPVAA